MPWWASALVFLAILVGGGWWLWCRVRATWRSVRALNDQVREASLLIAELDRTASRLPTSGDVQLAVFTHPYDAHRERTRTRAIVADERRARREPKLPPWARR